MIRQQEITEILEQKNSRTPVGLTRTRVQTPTYAKYLSLAQIIFEIPPGTLVSEF